jgi:hypothetical protein
MYSTQISQPLSLGHLGRKEGKEWVSFKRNLDDVIVMKKPYVYKQQGLPNG